MNHGACIHMCHICMCTCIWREGEERFVSRVIIILAVSTIISINVIQNAVVDIVVEVVVTSVKMLQKSEGKVFNISNLSF